MIKYVALLRGINVGGKNKVSMPILKKEFEQMNFIDVMTYINSGNIIFSSETEDIDVITSSIRVMIKDKFGIDIPVFIITIEKLEIILKEAPEWWGSDSKEIYDNAIFIIPPITYEDVVKQVGQPLLEYEKTDHYENVIYWSFQLKYYSKTNYIKTASTSINNSVTIRTANTLKKILALSKK